MKHITDINIVAYLKLFDINYEYIYKKDPKGKLAFVYTDVRVGELISLYKQSDCKNFASNLNNIRQIVHSLK